MYDYKREEVEPLILADISAGRFVRPLWLIHDMAVSWRRHNPGSRRGHHNSDWWYRLPKEGGKIFDGKLTKASKRLYRSINFTQDCMLDTPWVDFNQPAYNIACDVIVTITTRYPNARLAISHSGLRELIHTHYEILNGNNPPKTKDQPQEKARAVLQDRPANAAELREILAGMGDAIRLQQLERIVTILVRELKEGHYAVALPFIMEMACSLMLHDPNWQSYLKLKDMKNWRDALTFRDKDQKVYYKDEECAEKDRRVLVVMNSLRAQGNYRHIGFAIAAYIALTHASVWQRNTLEQLVEAHQYVKYYGQRGEPIRKPVDRRPEPDSELFEYRTYAERFQDDIMPKPKVGAKVAWRILQETREGHYTNAFRLIVPIAAYLVEAQSRGVHILSEKTGSGMTALDQDYGSKAIYHPTKDLAKDHPDIKRAIDFGMAHADLWEGISPEAKAVAVNMLAVLTTSFPFSALNDIVTAAAVYLKDIGAESEAAWIASKLPARPQALAPQGAFAQLAA